LIDAGATPYHTILGFILPQNISSVPEYERLSVKMMYASLAEHTSKVTGYAEHGIRATPAPVDERPVRAVMDDADTHAPCYMTSVPYVFDSFFKLPFAMSTSPD
jgi:hypothetical protein